MRRYFTSDLHLGSNLINKYAHRPYKDASTALADFLVNINSEMKRHDVLIHVGDFMLSGADRHSEVEDHGLDLKLDDYLDMIEPMVVLIAGNHDGYSYEAAASSMTVDLNQNWKHVYVSHYPSTHELYRGPVCNGFSAHSRGKNGRGIVLCGHVHDKWIVMYDWKKNVLNINVGVDVWGYRPVEDTALTELLDFIKSAKVKMPKTSLTPDELMLWHKQNEIVVKGERARRKLERYKKKGLTPTECQRRKEEAMRKKGLIK